MGMGSEFRVNRESGDVFNFELHLSLLFKTHFKVLQVHCMHVTNKM